MKTMLLKLWTDEDYFSATIRSLLKSAGAFAGLVMLTGVPTTTMGWIGLFVAGGSHAVPGAIIKRA